jgi:hypothetical protein
MEARLTQVIFRVQVFTMDLLRGYGEIFVCKVALGEGRLKWKIRREKSQPHGSCSW